MDGHYTIRTEPDRDLMRVTMHGFFSLSDVDRYHAAIAAASETLNVPPAQQLMLNDISDMKIQSQEIVAAFQRVMADPRYAGRRVGFVATSSLARAQLSRILGGRAARIFATEAEAEAWLFAAA